MDFIIMMVALFAIMYFLMIRPQQKRARKDQEMRSQLAPGDRVLLTSGLFATITHAGDKQFIVELAPDVQITVRKGSVARKVLPEDEEFEFTDEADDAEDQQQPRWHVGRLEQAPDPFDGGVEADDQEDSRLDAGG